MKMSCKSCVVMLLAHILTSSRGNSNYRARLLCGPRVGFVTAGGVDECIVRLEGAVKRLRKVGNTKTEWMLPKEKVWFSSRSRTGKVTALFSGQGSQYVNMFKDVAENWPQFRTQVTTVDMAGVKICGRKASSVLYPRKEYDQEPEKDKTIINSTLNAQPTTLGCELGVYSIFTDAGFKPEFVAGHSLGELAALVAGGCISNEDAAELVWHRAIAMSTGGAENIVGEDVEMKTSSKGGMAAVLGKGAANIEPTTPNVYVANRNAPQQLVISGESSAVLQESNRLSNQGFKVVQLKVGDAFHTPFMKDAETTFSTKVRSVGLRKPTAGVTVYSNVTGKPYPGDNSRAVNLLATQMTSSVQFVKQVENMYNDGARVFVEFGPRKTLTKLVGQILEGKPDVVTIAVNPGKPGDNSDLLMREAAAQMAVAGVTLGSI